MFLRVAIISGLVENTRFSDALPHTVGCNLSLWLREIWKFNNHRTGEERTLQIPKMV